MLSQMARFHSFLWLNIILLYTHTTVYLFIHQWALKFCILAIVNKASGNLGVHLSFRNSDLFFFR